MSKRTQGKTDAPPARQAEEQGSGAAPPTHTSAAPSSEHAEPPNVSVGASDLYPEGVAGGGLRVGPPPGNGGGGSMVGPGHPMFSGALHAPGVRAGPGQPGIKFDPIGARASRCNRLQRCRLATCPVACCSPPLVLAEQTPCTQLLDEVCGLQRPRACRAGIQATSRTSRVRQMRGTTSGRRRGSSAAGARQARDRACRGRACRRAWGALARRRRGLAAAGSGVLAAAWDSDATQKAGRHCTLDLSRFKPVAVLWAWRAC